MKFDLRKIKYPLLFALAFLVFENCTARKPASVPKLKLLDVYEFPYGRTMKGTQIGGLSGIDYHSKTDTYYIISDDRSEKGPARIYEAKLHLNSEYKIDSLSFKNVIFLKNEKQALFQDNKKNPAESVDPEDVKYNPIQKNIFWVNEGERLTVGNKMFLQNPSITISDGNGNYISTFHIPEIFNMQSIEKGPRRNATFESLSFNQDYTKLYTCLEGPLFEDGNHPTVFSGANSRFIEFDVATKQSTNQYFYPIDPIAKPPIPENSFAVNGISCILQYDLEKFLVVERSFSTGYLPCTVKIFDYDLKKAHKATSENKAKSSQKQLILNMDSLGVFTSNIEGICWGPKLKNGKRSILLISDDNFDKNQKTQIFLFEYQN